MKDKSFEFEQFMQAVENYLKAKREEREAFERYDGCSWGYHGRYEINRKEEASKITYEYFQKLIKDDKKSD